MRPLPSALLGALLSAVPLAAQTLDDADSLYLQGRYEESMSVLNDIRDTQADSVRTYVLIAENQYRMGNLSTARAFADAAVELQPCHGRAHDLMATLDGQQPWEAESRALAWAHARQAVECDPDNGNAWLTYWMSGVMRRDAQAQATAQRRIAEIGFIPEPVMEQARWMLRSAPRDAVLFTGGDWDYFPILVAQSQEGLRPDVTVAAIGMLETPWYVRELAGRAGWPVPAEAQGDDWIPALEDTDPRMLAAIAGAMWADASVRGGRPMVFAGTALTDVAGEDVWVRWHGPYYTLIPLEQAPGDPVMRIQEEDFAASMRELDLSRLTGPVVHPTDRSPIRRTASHPASTVLLAVLYYGNQSYEAGRMDDARQALAWGDALVATGHAGEDYPPYLAALRILIDGDTL